MCDLDHPVLAGAKNIDRKESTMMVCGDGEVAVGRGNGKAA
jgi:hypothetical protein